MDRRILPTLYRSLLILPLTLACSMTPGEADEPPASTAPSTTVVVPETGESVASDPGDTEADTPYPLAGNSLIRHRFHRFVPQPE